MTTRQGSPADPPNPVRSPTFPFPTSSFFLLTSYSAAMSSSLRRPWYRPSLTTQIFIGLIVAGAIGYCRPDWGNPVYFLPDIFLNLIKSILPPLLFSTTGVGIAGAARFKTTQR